MLAIRFNRVGRKNRAHFRLVVQEHTVAPGGRHVEIVGSYNPHLKQAVLKADRIKYWLSQGAQASGTAWNLLVREGVVEGKKQAVRMKRPAPAAAPAEEVKPEAAEAAAEPKSEE